MSADSQSSPGKKRVSQWEVLMRKFSDSHKVQCKSNSVDIPRAYRTVKTLPSGARYDGTWDVLGMSGFGTYTFSHGVVYQGEFHDGMFHGAGEMRYPSGHVLRGRWKKGIMVKRTLTFNDGIKYEQSDWNYCKKPDRRYAIEQRDGLKPAGESYLTANPSPKKIPPGYYDTGDGLFHPESGGVFLYHNLNSMLRAPSQLEQEWIKENCRFSSDRVTGACRNLFENWLDSEIQDEEEIYQDYGEQAESSTAMEKVPSMYAGDILDEDSQSNGLSEVFSHYSDLEEPTESSSDNSSFL